MRKLIKRFVPDLLVDFVNAKRRAKLFKNQPIKEVFTSYKETRFWNSSESLSGDGSELSVTIALRKELEQVLEQFKVKTMLDIPCGDFNWMQAVDLNNVQYIGADIVASLILDNSKKYATERVSFVELDLTSSSIPKVDLIFCRDCLVHLSYKDIYRALSNIKRSGSKYLLTTSFIETFKNKDIVTGEWRKLNLESSPFNLGTPLEVIDEKYTLKGERYTDKSMCLWRIEDIKLPLKLKVYSWFI
jgi:SAM-dependent methyltransferase